MSAECIRIALVLADEMEARHLDASYLVVAKPGLLLTWTSEFNKGRTAEIEINDDGYVQASVNGPHADHLLAWEITDFPFEGKFKRPEHKMNLAETLEYIRHFIWANHNV